jgi:ankyrin repeat protein
MILRKAKVNTVDQNGNSMLHLASDKGYADIVELLITNNAEINIGDADGKTPLHLASYKGHKQIAELLIGVLSADVRM